MKFVAIVSSNIDEFFQSKLGPAFEKLGVETDPPELTETTSALLTTTLGSSFGRNRTRNPVSSPGSRVGRTSGRSSPSASRGYSTGWRSRSPAPSPTC